MNTAEEIAIKVLNKVQDEIINTHLFDQLSAKEKSKWIIIDALKTYANQKLEEVKKIAIDNGSCCYAGDDHVFHSNEEIANKIEALKEKI